MDWHAAVMAGGLFAAGYPVDVAGGFYGGAELRFGEYHKEVLSLGLELRGLLPAAVYTYPVGARLEVSTITGALVPCARWRMLAGCLPLEAGVLIQGGSPADYRDEFLALVTIGPRLGLDLLMTERFALRAFADLRFPLLGPRISDPGLGKILWTWPTASVLFGLGVGFE